MSDGSGLAEALLGLDGFRVLAVSETVEVTVVIESVRDLVGCSSCGVRAEDRMDVEVRDLACFGRPARLVWRKRRWRCVDADCEARTWTEGSPAASSRQVLTRRAGAEACRQVGMNARPVAGLARELGVCWWTVMDAVIEHGMPLVEDPSRVGPVRQLGVDETSFLAANPEHSTTYATGLVDLEAHIVIDMVEGNKAADLRRCCRGQGKAFLQGITTVATAGGALSGRPLASPRPRHPSGGSVPRREGAPRGAMCSGAGERPAAPACRSRLVKLRAVRPWRCKGGREAALTTTRRAGTARRPGLG